MTAARRLPIHLCAAAAVALWLAWPTVQVGAEPLEPTLCAVGPVDPACVQSVVNRPPDAVDDELRSRPGRTMGTNVLRNDSDPDGDAFTVRPDANRTAGGSVSYAVSDGRGGSDTATVWIQVGNAPPVAVGDAFTTSPGHALSAGLVGTAAGGQVTFYGDGVFSYRTPAGFVGVDLR